MCSVSRHPQSVSTEPARAHSSAVVASSHASVEPPVLVPEVAGVEVEPELVVASKVVESAGVDPLDAVVPIVPLFEVVDAPDDPTPSSPGQAVSNKAHTVKRDADFMNATLTTMGGREQHHPREQEHDGCQPPAQGSAGL